MLKSRIVFINQACNFPSKIEIRFVCCVTTFPEENIVTGTDYLSNLVILL